jgi:hypothetical protein
VKQFAQNLRQLIAEDSAAGGNAAATDGTRRAAAPAADQAAVEGEATGTSQDGPGSTQPSPVVPAAATTATPTAQPPAASADSINLVKLVGPALLKRVIPVAVAAAGLALLGRWLFRRGAKASQG